MELSALSCGANWYSFNCLASLIELLLGLLPWGALIWAIYAFFRKRRDDRIESQRAKRQALYLELIDTVHSIRRAHVRNEDAEMWGYYTVIEKVCLVYPNEIPEQFHNHNMSLLYFLKTDSSDDYSEGMRNSEEAAFEGLLKIFREDLGLPATRLVSPIGPPMD